MRTTETVQVPCNTCGQIQVDLKNEKFLDAMKLSPAQLELAKCVGDESSIDFLDSIDIWIKNSLTFRDKSQPIEPSEWNSFFWIYELQMLVRNVRMEHEIEETLLANDIKPKKQETLPDEVWEVINTMEDFFTNFDAEKGMDPGTYKHLMKSTAVVIDKYRA